MLRRPATGQNLWNKRNLKGAYLPLQESGEGSLLPPHMDIKPLLFPVDNFICIGATYCQSCSHLQLYDC